MSPNTLTVQLDSQLGQELEAAVRDAGQSTSDLVIRAIDEWLDREDEREVLAILARNEPSSRSGDVRRRIGLEG